MEEADAKKIPPTAGAADEEVIPVKPSSHLSPGEFEAQNFFDDTVYYRLEDLREQWDALMAKVGRIVSSKVNFGDLTVDEVTVKFGFNAKGKLVFLAEAGIDVAFEVKF